MNTEMNRVNTDLTHGVNGLRAGMNTQCTRLAQCQTATTITSVKDEDYAHVFEEKQQTDYL